MPFLNLKYSIPLDTRASLTNTNAKDGYPISGLTWVLVYKNQNYNSRTIDQAKETKKLLKWMITDGQKYAEPLNYSPLSESLQRKADAILNSLSYNGQKNIAIRDICSFQPTHLIIVCWLVTM